MFIYQKCIFSEVGNGETGPMVDENWITGKGRSAKDATKRLKKASLEEGLRPSTIKWIKFSEEDKLTGEALKEFLLWEAGLADY